MENIIQPQTGVGFVLKRGQKLKVTDPRGQQVSDLLCINKQNRSEILSSGRSIDYNETIYLTVGHTLFSNQGNPMLKIIEDTCGRHDFLVTPCSLQMFQMIHQNHEYHPSCLENLSFNLAPFDISPDQIGTTFNIFMNIEVLPTGQIQIKPPLTIPGSFITFEAQMDLLVGLTACSDEQTNNGALKEISYKVL